MKTWKTLKVIRSEGKGGDLRDGVEDALNELSADGYEPTLVTEVGLVQYVGYQVLVSGWKETVAEGGPCKRIGCGGTLGPGHTCHGPAGRMPPGGWPNED